MSDAEWDGWESSWRDADGALPDVRREAQRRARRDRRANVVYFSLMAGGGVAVTASVLAGHDRPAGLVLLGWGALLCAWLAWTQRARRAPSLAAPRDALAFLERRVQVERRAAHVVRWMYVALLVAVPLTGTLSDAPVTVQAFAIAVLLLMFALAFGAPWWIRGALRAQEAEIERWRRWLEDEQL